MSLQGDFVISWTSFGQNGDAAWQSNIYAKQFTSNDYLRQTIPTPTSTLIKSTIMQDAQTRVVTSDDPAGHVVQPGTGYDGVVQILVDMGALGTGSGSGTLLLDRTHVLTAAHVVADATGQLASNNISVLFSLASGNVTIAAAQVIINPNYTGNPFTSPDVAIITLAQAARRCNGF